MKLTNGEYPQAPPPRVAPEMACSFIDCTEMAPVQLRLDGSWGPGLCETHWRQYWRGGMTTLELAKWAAHRSKW